MTEDRVFHIIGFVATFTATIVFFYVLAMLLQWANHSTSTLSPDAGSKKPTRSCTR